jgi:polysaccharide pyruvyl transferase WcaK-like protein
MLGKSVLAISFHEKVDSLMSAVGLTEFCQDIENIDVEKLATQFAALNEHTEYFKLQVQRKTESYRRALDRQYEDIFAAATVHESGAGRS